MAIASGLAAQIGMAEEVYTNQVQTLTMTGSPTGGTFTLTFNGQTTAAIAYNANASAVATALQALSNIGPTGCTTGGGALPGTPVTVTFTGEWAGVTQGAPPVMTANSGGLTGGSSPTLTPTITTAAAGYGTPVTVTRFLEFESETLAEDIQRIESTALRASTLFLRQDRWAANRKQAAGDTTFEVANTGFGMLFKHCFGTAQVTTPTNGVLTRDQTFTMTDQTGMSMTLQKGVPGVGGVVQPFTYQGCKVTQWEFSQDLDKILQLKVTWDAQDEATATALAAASFPSNQTLFHFGQGVMTIGGVNQDITKFTLTGTNSLNSARYFIRGNTLKKEPLPNAYFNVSGSVDAEFTDLTAYNLFVNGTQPALTFTWTGVQIEAVTPTYNYQVKFTIPAARFDGTTPQVAGPDIVPITLPFKAMQDTAGDNPCTLLYRTTDTAV